MPHNKNEKFPTVA